MTETLTFEQNEMCSAQSEVDDAGNCVNDCGQTHSSKKQVLMVSYAFPPLAASGVFRTTRFARYLPEFGWQPTILTIGLDAISESNTLDQTLCRLIPIGAHVERTGVMRPVKACRDALSRGRRYFLRSHTNVGEAIVERRQNASTAAPSTSIKHQLKNWLTPVMHIAPDTEVGWFFPALFRGISLNRRQHFDAIYCTGPPHSSHLIASCLSRITHKPLVLDLRDPWARQPWTQATGRWSDSRLENWCVRSAARVILNTKEACEDFQDHYSDCRSTKFAWIPNGTDPDFYEIDCRHRVGHEAETRGEHVFLHPGEVYGKRCIVPFVRALRILNSADTCARFEQVGNIANEESVRSELAQLELEGAVTLHGQQPHQKLLDMMRAATFFLVIQPQTSSQIPAKIFEMLNFRKPILALTGTGATADLVREFNLGIVEESDEPVRIAAAAKRLIQMQQEIANSDGWVRAQGRFNGRALTCLLADTLDAITTKTAP